MPNPNHINPIANLLPAMKLSRVVPLAALLAQAALTTGCPVVVGIAAVSAVDVGVDRQTVGRQVDDTVVEFKVGQSLSADQELEQNARIKVTSVQGLVLLVGEVPNGAAGLRAARIAAEPSEVVQVLNKTTVGAVADDAALSREARLVARAKFRMLRTTGTPGARVNLVSHGDTLYLMGVVTEEEGHAVASAIRDLKGLSRIVKVFEYVE